MTDLQATLDAIDEVAVHECGHCGRRLAPDGPSLDFCDDQCQTSWLRRRNEVQELVGYREPTELAAHVGNQREMDSPETTPRYGEWLRGRRHLYPGDISVTRDEVTIIDGFGRPISHRYAHGGMVVPPRSGPVTLRVVDGEFIRDEIFIEARSGYDRARLGPLARGAIEYDGLSLSSLPDRVEAHLRRGSGLNLPLALSTAFEELVDDHYANYRRRWLVGLDQRGQLTPVAEHTEQRDLDFDPQRVSAALRERGWTVPTTGEGS